MKQTSLTLTWLICIALLSGCSNQAVYESLKTSNKQSCELETKETEREQCQSTLPPDYETYQTEREKIITE